MAISNVNIASPANESIYTSSVMGATAEGIKASSATVFSVIIDNTANGAAATYVKLWNLASGSVVVGTTVPDEVIYVPAASLVTVVYYTGAAQGKVFGSALTAAALTAGGTAGVTGPSNPVRVTVNYV
jgi:hypothetical protein